MLARPRAALALLTLLFILALPASASAANFVVNSTADEPDAVAGGVCESAGGKCTLRAAIEVTNLTVAEKDKIEFSATVFKGTLASTIAPATALPAITAPLEIAGGDCFGEDGPNAPCAGIKGPSGAAALTVENANGVTIEGLAITGAQFGIDVVSSSEDFIARNDWIGLNLSAAKESNLTGIFLDPGPTGRRSVAPPPPNGTSSPATKGTASTSTAPAKRPFRATTSASAFPNRSGFQAARRKSPTARTSRSPTRPRAAGSKPKTTRSVRRSKAPPSRARPATAAAT